MLCRWFCSSLTCGCCPVRAAGRLPGAGHGVRGENSPLHPLHPRTPLCAGTRNLSPESGCTPPAAWRAGHRREPSRPFRPGDVRACCGAPSALRAYGIAFAPAPSLHQRKGRKGLPLPDGNKRRTADKGSIGRQYRREIDGAIVPGGGQGTPRAACGSFEIRVKLQKRIKNTIKSRCLPHARGGVSLNKEMIQTWQQSSPRTWGCFRRALCTTLVLTVFPTHVGVFPHRLHRTHGRDSLPHARGGVSHGVQHGRYSWQSSPRMWG